MLHPQLMELSERIAASHREAESARRALARERRGAGALLAAARALCPEGAWPWWLESHCGLSVEEAEAYVRRLEKRDRKEAEEERASSNGGGRRRAAARSR